MASIPTPPITSKDEVGQDRFNQDVVALLKEQQELIAELQARVELLENP